MIFNNLDQDDTPEFTPEWLKVAESLCPSAELMPDYVALAWLVYGDLDQLDDAVSFPTESLKTFIHRVIATTVHQHRSVNGGNAPYMLESFDWQSIHVLPDLVQLECTLIHNLQPVVFNVDSIAWAADALRDRMYLGGAK